MFAPPLMTMLRADTPVPELTSRVALPLTYDEADYNALLSWTRLGAGPRITPQGLLGDGYTARLKATAPSWANDDAHVLTVHASIKLLASQARHSTRDTVVFVGNDDATANPKLELCVMDDALVSTEPNICLRSYTGSMQTKVLGRRNWRYEFRHPQLTLSGDEARPQGLHFLDSNTLLITAHYEGTVSRCHKVRASDGAVLGYFDFDQAPLGVNHINAITQSADGRVWFCGNGWLYGVDLDASFASHAAVIHTTYDMSAAGTSFMSIATISGTEYMICGQYMESGDPRLRVFPFSLVTNGGTFDIGDRTIQYIINQRTQGIVYHSGKLYMSNNRTTASAVQGTVKRFDLNLAGVDDSTMVTSEVSRFAPSQYPEDLTFHPLTGRIWTCTEGLSSVGSDDGFMSVWSSEFTTGDSEENHYTAEYDGAGTVTVKINNRLFEALSWTPTINPGAFSIGGPPAASAGQQNGFFLGTVRNVVIQDSPLSRRGYGSAVGGRYEPNDLTVHAITLTNPGAEAGSSTGWTNETGGISERTSNPPGPHSGTYYFFGGANAASRARQRIDLVAATGLTGTRIDAGDLWAIVDWWQSNFSAADADTGGLGLRFLDGSSTLISENLAAALDMTPELTWIPRSYGLLIPTGTRYIDVLYDATRASGTNLDTYVDDIALRVYVP